MILKRQLADIEEVLGARKEHNTGKRAILKKKKSVISCKEILEALQKCEEDTNSMKKGKGDRGRRKKKEQLDNAQGSEGASQDEKQNVETSIVISQKIPL